MDNWTLLIPILTGSLALVGSVFIWWLNERSKRRLERFNRREERYSKLILSLRGFSIDGKSQDNGKSPEKINDFLDQLNLSWLYVPDRIIHKLNGFLDTVNADKSKDFTEADREKVLGELMVAIRKDILNNKNVKETYLASDDFKFLQSNIKL